MKCIVLFGAGKSSSALIQYLKTISLQHNWQVFVADASLEAAANKTGDHTHVKPVGVDVYDEAQRALLIQKASVVISLLPPQLHILVARDCVQYQKHLLTASYIDDHIRLLEKDIKDKGLLFLCEMGLDPGIDHMSAMQLIHQIQEEGGVITSFKSHCGGLVAPESDDNPWHYKISWNPRNVVMAGKAGATYKENNAYITKDYQQVFAIDALVAIPTLHMYCYYPNRDSLSYAKLYGLETAHTFMRTTLRHPEFCLGWKNVIDLKFTDESIFYDTDNLSVADFFREHYENVDFENWMNDNLEKGVELSKKLNEYLSSLNEVEQSAIAAGEQIKDEFMLITNEGNLVSVNVSAEKEKATVLAGFFQHKANVSLMQLFFLGLEDEETIINKGTCSVIDIFQFILEKKLALNPQDKDMIVMLHEIEYLVNNEPKKKSSYLIVKGENNVQTAMAKTVGLPLGIAAKLLLEGKLSETGLHIPILPSIYEPVLQELAEQGIKFTEC